MGFVDDYLFEGLHLLVAEDGSVEGPFGAPLLQLVDGRFWVNNHAHVLTCESPDDLRYLYYALSTVPVRPYLTGSVQAKLSQGNMNRIPVPHPDRKTRQGIVAILKSLDDKIELNRKMSATLEATARALFESWFVDFDPVRAKAEGRNTGLPPQVAALFPNAFENSDLREIPKGWSTHPLPDVVELNPSRSLAGVSEAPYVEMAGIPTQSFAVQNVVFRAVSSGSRFMNGDTLMARITPCLENGKTAFVDFLYDDQVGWGSTEFIVLRPRPPLPPEYGYLLARSQEFRSFAIAKMTGSSGRQRVPIDSLTTFSIALPTPEVCHAFASIIQPIFRRISQASHESKTLRALRDVLLPKLISGEVRVMDAERLVQLA